LGEGRKTGVDRRNDWHQVAIDSDFPDLDLEPLAEDGVAETDQNRGQMSQHDETYSRITIATRSRVDAVDDRYADPACLQMWEE